MANSILLPQELKDGPKSYFIRKTIANYLQELKEGLENAEISLVRK